MATFKHFPSGRLLVGLAISIWDICLLSLRWLESFENHEPGSGITTIDIFNIDPPGRFMVVISHFTC